MGSLSFVVCGFAALGVDVSLITMSQLQAQATADAASHAALVMYRKNNSTAEGVAAAQFIIDKDVVGMGHATLDAGMPEFGNYDFEFNTFSPGMSALGNANAVRVGVSRVGDNSVRLLIAPMLGFPTHDVTAESITAQQKRAIMLIQDMSCSMMGSSASAAVNQSRIASQAFLTFLSNQPQDGDLLGLAMFAQLGVTAPTAGHPTGQATNSATAAPWAPLMDLADYHSTLVTRFDGICNTSAGQPCPISGQAHPRQSTIGSCTNPAIAVAQAVNQLTTQADSTFFRGIVLMSDGLPNCNASGNSDPSAGARTVAAVDTAWANDINVWTIVYHNGGEFDADFMTTLNRGVGFSQISPDAADLPAMYEQVARSMPVALVY